MLSYHKLCFAASIKTMTRLFRSGLTCVIILSFLAQLKWFHSLHPKITLTFYISILFPIPYWLVLKWQTLKKFCCKWACSCFYIHLIYFVQTSLIIEKWFLKPLEAFVGCLYTKYNITFKNREVVFWFPYIYMNNIIL